MPGTLDVLQTLLMNPVDYLLEGEVLRACLGLRLERPTLDILFASSLDYFPCSQCTIASCCRRVESSTCQPELLLTLGVFPNSEMLIVFESDVKYLLRASASRCRAFR